MRAGAGPVPGGSRWRRAMEASRGGSHPRGVVGVRRRVAARRGVVRGRVRRRGAGRGRGRVRLSLGRGVGSGPRVRSGGPALVPARGRARGAGLTAGAVGRHRGPPRVVGGRVAGRALRRAGVRVRAGTGLRSGRGGRGAGVRVGARGRASGSARGGWLGKKRSGTGRDGISATRDARGRTGTGICPPPVSCAGRACANAGCIAPAATRRAARSGAGGARGRAGTAPASRSPREFRRIR